ncbi:MAG TPA: NAD(P)/FAD-dependent oxidoreductase, partial [Terriglobales bacterium]|nr:NAD(P)/FAD-dependent oxidoreductase [Terriglobales bacterium]
PGHPEVYVVGDLASCRDKLGRQMPGLAPVAMQEGRHAAANILRAIAGRPPRPFRYFDKGMLATIGRAAAVAQIGPLHLSGLVAWWTWVTVHISYLIGFRNRLVVMLEWAWSYLSYQRAARLITGDIDAVYPVREIPAESREAR